MPDFTFEPSLHVPFRDLKAIEMARRITRADFENHPNPNLRVQVLPGPEIGFLFLTDMFFRIKEAMEQDRRLVMIIPQPWPLYARLASMLNRARINCRNLYTFNMDEYADQDGHIAPESWAPGFTHALKKYFYANLDPSLRPPESQMTGLTNENFKVYGKMISDLGGADVCYSGPGWTGHMAFVDPDAPEVPKELEAFKRMGPSIVTLSPFTIAQNSLHGCFGSSGDLAAVPPKAATIGPAQFLEAKHNVGFYTITIRGTAASWQRLVARLALFAPVTPLVPDSIIQLKKADIYVAESIAQDIAPDWEAGY